MLHRIIAFVIALVIFDLSVDTDHLRNAEFFSSEQQSYDDIDDMVELIVEYIAGNSNIFNDKINNDANKESTAPVKSCASSFLLYYECVKPNIPVVNPLLL